MTGEIVWMPHVCSPPMREPLPIGTVWKCAACQSYWHLGYGPRIHIGAWVRVSWRSSEGTFFRPPAEAMQPGPEISVPSAGQYA